MLLTLFTVNSKFPNRLRQKSKRNTEKTSLRRKNTAHTVLINFSVAFGKHTLQLLLWHGYKITYYTMWLQLTGESAKMIKYCQCGKYTLSSHWLPQTAISNWHLPRKNETVLLARYHKYPCGEISIRTKSSNVISSAKSWISTWRNIYINRQENQCIYSIFVNFIVSNYNCDNSN